MCFSAEADFAAAAVIAIPAADALRHADQPRELPIALLPSLLAVHSLLAALVWLHVEGDLAPTVGNAAAWLYALIAFPLLPALVPWAIFALEEVRWRQIAIGIIGMIGAAVGAVFLFRLISHGYVAVAHDDYIHWGIAGNPRGSLLTAGYLIATCGAMLLSGERWLVIYGLANAAAVAVIAWTTAAGFASIWCLWAAITSCLVALFLRSRQESQRGPCA